MIAQDQARYRLLHKQRELNHSPGTVTQHHLPEKIGLPGEIGRTGCIRQLDEIICMGPQVIPGTLNQKERIYCPVSGISQLKKSPLLIMLALNSPDDLSRYVSKK